MLLNFRQRLLTFVNLRADEVDRTALLFCFHAITSIALLWLENTALALFLESFGTTWLPVIYLASALLGSGLGLIYSRLEKYLPIRVVLVGVALVMAMVMLGFYWGLERGPRTMLLTVFGLRLWVDLTDTLKNLNTAIAANQLFNIREIKRTYPLIASGVLVAELVSGFSLPLVISLVGINRVILLSGLVLLGAAGVLFYLSHRYAPAFPSTVRGPSRPGQPRQSHKSYQKLHGYTIPLLGFFALVQVVLLLVEFLYLQQVEALNLDVGLMASFLAIFSGLIGLFELLLQWFVSSRLLDRLGVFVAAMLLPGTLIVGGLLALSGLVSPLTGVIIIKFLDEIFRYTTLAGLEPALFQPLPERLRNRYQARVQGMVQPITMGLTGLMLWGITGTGRGQYLLVLLGMIACASLWLYAAWRMRSTYVGLLVQRAEQGRLDFAHVDLGAWKKAIVQTLEQSRSEADQHSCIRLLSQIDPAQTGDILVPLLPKLSPFLQCQSLQIMLKHPKLEHVASVERLMSQSTQPEVLALGLRYVWLVSPELELSSLDPYLKPEVAPPLRATAAALLLRWGTPPQKSRAMDLLRRLLTSPQEGDRIVGCLALGQMEYLQALRLHIRDLLQDPSVRVRCAVLEVIALLRLEEYYQALVAGLRYRSTKEAATAALVQMGDEAVPLLRKVAVDPWRQEIVRSQAWQILASIATPPAVTTLAQELITSWGTTRSHILKAISKIPQDKGIDVVLDLWGRSGVAGLIEQELAMAGQLWAAALDLQTPEAVGATTPFLELLLQALEEASHDCLGRLFKLMQLLYPEKTVAAIATNLQSTSPTNLALGLEILDSTVDLAIKPILLALFEQTNLQQRLECLRPLVSYQPLSPCDRLKYLMELHHFLPDWPLACGFHLAKAARWSIPSSVVITALNHPANFVREAVVCYLRSAAPRTGRYLLAALAQDDDPLVAASLQSAYTNP